MIKIGDEVKFEIDSNTGLKRIKIVMTGKVKEIKGKFTDYVIDKNTIEAHTDIIKRNVKKI